MNHLSFKFKFVLILLGAIGGWALNSGHVNASQSNPMHTRPNFGDWKRIAEDFNAGNEMAKQIILEHGIFIPKTLIRTLDLSKLGDPEALIRTLPPASYLIFNFKKHQSASHSFPLSMVKLKGIIEEEDKKDNPQNPYAIGWCYREGLGVSKTWEKAIKWYKMAAAQKFPVAQNSLAYYYLHSRGMPRNLSQTARWFESAAEQGFASAQGNLACCYQWGKGVTQDRVQAVFWYRAAAIQGFFSAQLNLRIILRPAKDTSPFPVVPESLEQEGTSPPPSQKLTFAQACFNLQENAIGRPLALLREQNNPDFEDNLSPSEDLFKTCDTLLKMIDLLKDIYFRIDQPGFMMTNLSAKDYFTSQNLLNDVDQQDLDKCSDLTQCPFVATFTFSASDIKIFTSIGQENVWATYQLMRFFKQHAINKQEIEKGITRFEKSADKENDNKSAFQTLLTLPQDLQKQIKQSAPIRNQKYQDENPWLFD